MEKQYLPEDSCMDPGKAVIVSMDQILKLSEAYMVKLIDNGNVSHGHNLRFEVPILTSYSFPPIVAFWMNP